MLCILYASNREREGLLAISGTWQVRKGLDGEARAWLVVMGQMGSTLTQDVNKNALPDMTDGPICIDRTNTVGN